MVNNTVKAESGIEPKITRREFLQKIIKIAQLALIRLTADQVAPLAKSFSRENPISKEKISPQEHIVILDVFDSRDKEGNIVEYSYPLSQEDRELTFYPPEAFSTKQNEKEYYYWHLYRKASGLLMEAIGKHGKLMYKTFMTVLKTFKGEQFKTRVPLQINIADVINPSIQIIRNEQTGVIQYTVVNLKAPNELVKNVRGKIVSFSFQIGDIIGRLTPPEKVTKEKYKLITASDIFSNMFQKNSDFDNDQAFQKIKKFINDRYGKEVFYSPKDAKTEDQFLVFTSEMSISNLSFNELYRYLTEIEPENQDKYLNSIKSVILSTRVTESLNYTYTSMSPEDIEKFDSGKYYGSNLGSDQYNLEIIGAYSPKNPNRKKGLEKMFAFGRLLGMNGNMLLIPTGNSGDVILPEEKKDIPNNTIIVGSCNNNGESRYNTSGADVYIEIGSSSEATVSFSTLLSYYCSETNTLPNSLNRKKVLKLIDALSTEVNGNKVIKIDDLANIKSKVRSVKI